MANTITRQWGSADEENRHKLLQSMFVKFVVDQQRIVDIELKPPYSWLLRWKPEQAEVLESVSMSVGMGAKS